MKIRYIGFIGGGGITRLMFVGYKRGGTLYNPVSGSLFEIKKIIMCNIYSCR